MINLQLKFLKTLKNEKSFPLNTNNSKKYLSLLDDIANKTDNNKTPDITAGTWFDYFSNLNKKTNFSGKDLIDKLEAIENETTKICFLI
jgi:hypothetical protein